ncbi:metallophosphoesterase [Caldicoprobacter algeriensis]|uniref:metallophosphoesterase n=1 Tax=Caldicoprobacter algeriensis TaxID=699281 RepID=UPI002079539F|nr:metallophosphoesterase [Caldicoprobacter algeriensis]MCM8901313.1 metallophosphoesterase [Caldicoprobacter algeriensis]
MPKVVVADLPETLETVELYPVSDLHVGDPEFKEKEFLNFLNYIEHTNNAYVVLLGDLMNNAIKTSISNVYNETMPPSQQKKYLIEKLKPISHKILAITTGNHEYRSKKDVDVDLTEDLAMSLGLEDRYSPNGVVLKIRFGHFRNNRKIAYNVYLTHGYSATRRPGGVLNNVELSQLAIENIDVYIMGHAHKQIVYPAKTLFFDDKNNCLLEEIKYFVLTGAWAGWSGYAERKGYRPQKSGCPKVVLYSGLEKKVSVEV